MRMHKSTVSPKTRPNIDVVFCVFALFDEYLWFLDATTVILLIIINR